MALIAGLIAVVATIAIVAIYENTKDAYRSVGFNDGTIAANVKIIQRIDELVLKVTVCTPEQQDKAKEIVSVKSEALYIIVDDLGRSIFCKSK
jgi:hypothetical protein